MLSDNVDVKAGINADLNSDINGFRLMRCCGTGTSYTVPSGVTEIEELAFAGCESLTEIMIGDQVTYIGNYAFDMCHQLRRIRMPASAQHVGTGLFHHCWQLTQVKLPEGLRYVGGEMFEACHSLRTIWLPSTIRKIESNSFNSCRNIRDIFIEPDKLDVLPASLRNIAVLTYMRHHSGAEGAPAIDSYSSGRKRLLLDLAVNRRDAAAVRYMLARGLITGENLETYISKSAERNRVEITALLLDHIGSVSDIKDRLHEDLL